MKIQMIAWTIAQGFKNILRNKLISLVSLLTMSVSIFLFSMFLVLFLNFESTIRYIQRDICMTVFFNKDAQAEEIKDIGEKILANDKTDRLEYTSSNDAWDDFLEDYFGNDEEIRELFKEDNPLKYSSSYTVYPKDVSMQTELAEYIRGLKGVRQVNESVKIAELFSDFRTAAGSVTAFIMAVLVCVSVFLIGSTIAQGIVKRKNEIRIMKFCGATELMIRGQFLVEGILIGLIGSSVPLIVVIQLYKKMDKYLMENYTMLVAYIKPVGLETVFHYLIPSVFLIGIGIGYIGSRFAMHKYLKI